MKLKCFTLGFLCFTTTLYTQSCKHFSTLSLQQHQGLHIPTLTDNSCSDTTENVDTHLGGAQSCLVASSNVPTYVFPRHVTFTTSTPETNNMMLLWARLHYFFLCLPHFRLFSVQKVHLVMLIIGYPISSVSKILALHHCIPGSIPNVNMWE